MDSYYIDKWSLVSRRSLQIIVAVFSLVPIFAGLVGVVWGPRMEDGYGIVSTTADSHYRYLSGLLLGIGITFWTTIPDIETKTSRFLILTAIVFLGGLGRIYSLVAIGTPSNAMLFALTMEIVVTPSLALWQGGVARQFNSRIRVQP